MRHPTLFALLLASPWLAACPNESPTPQPPMASVSIDSPPQGSAFNATASAALPLAGSCSVDGAEVRLTGSAAATTPCVGHAWVALLDLSLAADGELVFEARLVTEDGESAPALRHLVKDTRPPALAVTGPEAGSLIPASAARHLVVRGSCSESGRPVRIAAPLTGSANCLAGQFELGVDLLAAEDGDVELELSHDDAAGNLSSARLALRLDTGAPVASIAFPPELSLVGAAGAAAFAVGGGCTEEGEPVLVEGAVAGGAPCAGGAWTAVLDLSSLAEGAFPLRARQTDLAGNESAPAERLFIKDTGAPTLTIATPLEAASIDAERAHAVPMSGACSEDGLTVLVTGAAHASAPCVGGAWSAHVDLSAAPEGPAQLVARHSDAAGNSVEAVRNLIRLGQPGPVVAIVAPPAGSTVNALQAPSFALLGTCSESGGEILVDGSAVAVCSNRSWSAQLDLTAAADGDVVVTVGHASFSGQAAPTVSRTFRKDTAAPAVSFGSPANGGLVGAAHRDALPVSGTCTEEGRPVSIGGFASAQALCSSGSFNALVDLSGAADGPLLLQASQLDAAGNASAPAFLGLVLDTLAPSIAFTSPTPSSFVNALAAGALRLEGRCTEEGAQIAIGGDAVATGFCASGGFLVDVDLTAAPDGPISLHATLHDRAGNPAEPALLGLVKDALLPGISILLPAPGSAANFGNASSFALEGACSEAGGIVRVGGAASLEAPCDAQGRWAVTLDLGSLEEGPFEVWADHVDAAGNAAARAVGAYVKDTGFPSVNFLGSLQVNAANADRFPVTGSCSEGGGQVVVSGSASAVAECTSYIGLPPDRWAAIVDLSGLPDGTLSLSAAHFDAAGNLAVAERVLQKDTVAPAVTVTLPAGPVFVNYTTMNAIGFAGTCSEPGSRIHLYPTAQTAPCGTNGLWSLNLYFTPLPQGDNEIQVTAVDTVGNASPAVTVLVSKDTLRPWLTITDPSSHTAVPDLFTVSGECSEDEREVVITLEARDFVGLCHVGQAPQWSIPLDVSSLREGSFNVIAKHRDAADNLYSAFRAFSIDRVAPYDPRLAIDGGAAQTDSAEVSLSLAASGDPAQMLLNDSADCSGPADWIAYATSASRTLANLGAAGIPSTGAVNHFSVKFRDAAGNESECVSASIVHAPYVTRPAYPAAAAWMDSIALESEAAGEFHQPGTACVAASTTPCLHGGELRRVELSDRASCDGLLAEDALAAFDWTCADAASSPAEPHVTFFGRLKEDKGLRDLLLPDGWKPNSVTVYEGGAPIVGTYSGAWWSNPVAPLPANGEAGDSLLVLSGTGRIHTVAGDRFTNGYQIPDDKVALVGIGPRPTLTWSGSSALNCSWSGVPGAYARCLVAASAANHLWFENLALRGSDGGYATGYGLLLYDCSRAHLVDLEVSGCAAGTALSIAGYRCYGARLDGISVRDNLSPGISLNGPNVLGMGLSAARNAGTGLSINSSDSRFEDVVAVGNSTGISITGTNVRLSRLAAVENSGTGIHLGGRSIRLEQAVTAGNQSGLEMRSYYSSIEPLYPSAAVSVLSVGNTAAGVTVSAPGATLQAVTSVGNATGISVAGRSITVAHALIANNETGLLVWEAVDNTISQLALVGNGIGVQVEAESIAQRFTGNLLLAGNDADCLLDLSEGPLATPGLVEGTCTLDGTAGSSNYPAGSFSDAVLRFAADPSGAFVGPLFEDEATNASDQLGARPYAEIVDWSGFANAFRTWAPDAAGFASPELRGGCAEGQTCRIWDWRLASGDTVFRNSSGDATTPNPAFLQGAACPALVAGNVTTYNGYGDLFLTHAIELLGDDRGDEDGLCESNESCLYLPNFGAYQGEGSWADNGCVFDPAGGPITGVTMHAHPTNGG